jgi:pyruvate kinase
MLNRDDQVILDCGAESAEVVEMPYQLPVAYPGLSAELKVEDPVMLADGLVRLKVESTSGTTGGLVNCTVIDGGLVSARKGVNVPHTVVNLPSIGDQDIVAMNHAMENGADFIAVSYVRSPEDLAPVNKAIDDAGLHTWVVAKIEHPAALEKLSDILANCNAVMVARGDLGVEIPLEKVPAAQELIVQEGMARGLPVIIATQMLESMIENPRPTRAEVTDVATAIRQGASCVMLSGETATGKYPVVTVETMARIATSVEEDNRNLANPPALSMYRSTRAVANAGVELASGAEVDRLIVATEHATAARLVAAYRPEIPVTAMTHRVRATRKTTMIRGVDSVLVKEEKRTKATIQSAVDIMLKDGRLVNGNTLVAVTGSPLAISGRTSAIHLLTVDHGGKLVDYE